MREALKQLRGKVVVITGASSGIGREAAMQFAHLGCKVALAARRAPDLEQTARLCRAAGGEALVAVTDVTREDDVQRLALALHAARLMPGPALLTLTAALLGTGVIGAVRRRLAG